MEWYGNGHWAAGTAVHAKLNGGEHVSQGITVDSGWHTWRVQWDDAGMRFWKDYTDGAQPYFNAPANSLRTGSSTLPATNCSRSWILLSPVPVVAIPARAPIRRTCSSTRSRLVAATISGEYVRVAPRLNSARKSGSMPLVRIDVPASITPERRRIIGDVVYETLVEILNVPEHDNFQIITAHDRDGLRIDSEYLGVDRSADAFVISITLNAVPSVELKKQFYAELVKRVNARADVRPQDVFISLTEVLQGELVLR